jgi:hypothetical protein
MEPTVIQHESSTRRRKVTKFALAGVAVLGVGAALTSAAWTDNVWFGGDATAAEFELAGSNDQVSWVIDSTDTATIELPELDTIGPGVSDSVNVWVQNQGDIPIYLSDAVITVVEPTLVDAFQTDFEYSRTTLGPDQIARVTVTVTGTESLQEGDSSPILVQIEGSSEAPTATP